MKATFEGEYLYDKEADDAMDRYYALQNIDSIEGFKKFILDTIVENEYEDIAILLDVIEKDKSRENEILEKCLHIFKNHMNENNNLLILDEFAKLYQKSEIYDENTLKELFNMALNYRNILVILDYIVEFDKDFVANNYDKLKSLALDTEDKLLLAKHYPPKRYEFIRDVLEDADNDEMMYEIYDKLEEIKE